LDHKYLFNIVRRYHATGNFIYHRLYWIMNKDNFTVIVADFMYLTLIGSLDQMDQVIEIMNNNRENKHYISIHTETPIAEILESDTIKKILIDDCRRNNLDLSQKELAEQMKYCVFAEGMETAQCLIYADGYRKDHMLMEVSNDVTCFKISFPVIQLDEEVTPDKLIGEWIIRHNIQSIVNDITIRPVSIVGNKNDILVFVSIINQKCREKIKELHDDDDNSPDNGTLNSDLNSTDSKSIDSLDSMESI